MIDWLGSGGPDYVSTLEIPRRKHPAVSTMLMQLRLASASPLPLLLVDSTNIATEVFLNNDGVTAADLSRKLGADPKNVSEAVKTLVESGIVTATTVGRSRILTSNTEAPFYGPVLQLLTIVQGPPATIAAALDGCPGVAGAFIFGSWAARAAGVDGPLVEALPLAKATDR